MLQKNLAFENAMFGGYDSIREYYLPMIHNKVREVADSRRAPLNHADLVQVCSLIVLRCWNHQRRRVDMDSFDNYVKRACTSELRSQIGKEFCRSRGRFSISFFSELEQTIDPDDGANILDLIGESTPGYHDDPCHLFEDCVEKLGKPLSITFQALLNEVTYSGSTNDTIASKKIKHAVAKKLKIDKMELDNQVEDIFFILNGYRNIFNSL